MAEEQKTQIDPDTFAYQALSTIHFRESVDYEAQLKERLTVFLMAKYLVDDFNHLEDQSFAASDAAGVTLSKLGFNDLLAKIGELNHY